LLRPDAAISGNANTGGIENTPPVKPVAKVWSKVWFLLCRVLGNAEFSAENQQCRLPGESGHRREESADILNAEMDGPIYQYTP
jgi:hypothetical protein